MPAKAEIAPRRLCARFVPRSARGPKERRIPPKWPVKWNLQKHWRLRATAADGLTVTLGRYATAEEADVDRGRFASQGEYRDLAVQPIFPPPEPDPVEDQKARVAAAQSPNSRRREDGS